MNRKSIDRNNCGGFTLVEMLAVVLIITILAGLISAAALRALKRAKVAAIGVEINQLSMALEKYKTDLGGEYPPDFAGLRDSNLTIDLAAKNIVLIHISRAFPRLVIIGADTAAKWANLRTEIINTTDPDVDIDAIFLNPSTALRFWLGGMSNASGRPIGFSKDPAHPFDNTTLSRIGPFYDFDPGRLPLLSAAELGRYYPPGVPAGTGKPYVYFRSETGQGHPVEYCIVNGSNPPPLKTWSDVAGAAILDSAKPYWDDRNKCWINDTSFQILCCGLDGKFGKENVYKSGRVAGAGVPDGTSGTTDLRAYVIGIDSASFQAIVPTNYDHLDDQNNFTSGTIGDDLP